MKTVKNMNGKRFLFFIEIYCLYKRPKFHININTSAKLSDTGSTMNKYQKLIDMWFNHLKHVLRSFFNSPHNCAAGNPGQCFVNGFS